MINNKLQFNAPLNAKTLGGDDIVHVIRHLLQVQNADIHSFKPDLSFEDSDPGNLEFIVQRADEELRDS